MANDKVRIRATLIVEYEADPKDYESDVPKEMAEEDQESLAEGGLTLEDFVDDVLVDFSFKAVPD
ncbi:hypothetical protein [Kitasatospora mediocidica]|uniref:hypothetical protein n=1 Tax=Kitasatospora mediocidica TaxID=58352 RepID=UPI00055DBBF7|nr:hypothetical protein [Kitasatospora mediocidica]